jgi:hypothetical protein
MIMTIAPNALPSAYAPLPAVASRRSSPVMTRQLRSITSASTTRSGRHCADSRKDPGKPVKTSPILVWGATVQLGAYKDGSMVDFFRMVKKGEQIVKVSSARYSPRPEKNIGSLNGPDRVLGRGTELEVEAPSEGTPLRWSPSSS